MNSPFLPDWLLFHAERTPDAPAIATPAVRLSYGVLADRVRALAGHLAAGGIGQGDRVLLALPNTPATVVAALAVQLLGGTAVEANRAWHPDVLVEIVTRSRARQAFVWGRDAEAWAKASLRLPIDRLWVVHPATLPGPLRSGLGTVPASLLLEDGRVDPDLGTSDEPPKAELAPDSPALVLYTSGSTGKPHGVVQTFRNIEANTRSIVQYLGLTAEDRALLTLPLYYCYGRSVLQTHLYAGGSLFLDSRSAFPRIILETMASEKCTGFAGVPLTFEIMRRVLAVSTVALPRLRYVTQAGGPMAPDTIVWVRKTFHPANLFVMYGQTEATARLSCLPPDRAADKEGSVGIPIPGVELRVVDEQGNEIQPGEVGELVARGDNVTPGYLDEPEETAAILRDGWLWTGDLAYRDADGFIFLRGRAREILKVGGKRVSPVEIEQAIARHPDVAEVAVVGMKQELMGQVPVAFIVRRPGGTVANDDLQRHCHERLPPYMVPVEFIQVDALPRNEAGKLLREDLAARVATG